MKRLCKSIVSGMRRATINWASCWRGIWDSLRSPADVAPLPRWDSRSGLVQDLYLPPLTTETRCEQAEVVFSSSSCWQLRQSSGVRHGLLFWKKKKRQIKLFFSTPLIGLHTWARYSMSEYNACLAWSKFRVSRQPCFLNMRHRISLHCQDRHNTTNVVFLYALILLAKFCIHITEWYINWRTCTAAASKKKNTPQPKP